MGANRAGSRVLLIWVVHLLATANAQQLPQPVDGGAAAQQPAACSAVSLLVFVSMDDKFGSVVGPKMEM